MKIEVSLADLAAVLNKWEPDNARRALLYVEIANLINSAESRMAWFDAYHDSLPKE